MPRCRAAHIHVSDKDTRALEELERRQSAPQGLVKRAQIHRARRSDQADAPRSGRALRIRVHPSWHAHPDRRVRCGEIAVLLDTRRRLGLPSLEQETCALIELLKAREQDHVNWLEALESAVRDQKAFHLTTDPHQCAFGRWYDQFQTDNPLLQTQLQAFDEPHKALHALGVELIHMSENGQQELALYRLEQARGSILKRLISLFASVRESLYESTREIALVLEWQDQLVALSVDTVSAVEYLDEEARQATPAIAGEDGERCVNELGQRQGGHEMIQILDLDALLLPLQGCRTAELAV